MWLSISIILDYNRFVWGYYVSRTWGAHLQYISSFLGMKLLDPIVFLQTLQQKQLSCH